MKIAIAGVRYSQNLGDGVISDCLIYAIKNRYPDADVCTIDIAGRSEFEIDNKDLNKRAKLLSLVNFIPKFARPFFVAIFLLIKKKNITSAWLNKLDKTDCVVIGGGQILADTDLNFPIKIYFLINHLIKLNVKAAYFCCGVSAGWSFIGRKIFKKCMLNENIKYISVRDDLSKKYLKFQLENISDDFIRVVPDPAIVSACAYESHVPVKSGIGISVSDPDALAYSAKINDYAGSAWYVNLFSEIALNFVAEGECIYFFTNGAIEDEIFLDKLMLNLRDKKAISRLPRAKNPVELVSYISDKKLIISHRLHANIVAYSHDIPSVGLEWDIKLLSFFKMTRRESYFAGKKLDANKIHELCKMAISSGVDSCVRKNLTDIFWKSLDEMLNDVNIKKFP